MTDRFMGIYKVRPQFCSLKILATTIDCMFYSPLISNSYVCSVLVKPTSLTRFAGRTSQMQSSQARN